jgi:hypothetical protein
MSASQKPKTPSMTMIIRTGVEECHVNDFCKKASRLTLAQVVREVKVTERRWVAGESRRMSFLVVLSFYPEEEYREEYAVESWEIMSSFGEQFPQLLRREIALELKKISANVKNMIAELGKGRKVTTAQGDRDGEGEDEDGGADADDPSQSKTDDEKSELGDGDGEDAKRARQQEQQATYESDGETEAQDEDIVNDVEGEEDDAMTPAPGQDLHELGSQVRQVGEMFENHFPFGEDFSFSPTECSFRIEVSNLLVSRHVSYHSFSCFSSLVMLPKFCSLASLNVFAARRSSAKSRGSQNASQVRKRSKVQMATLKERL